MIWRHATLSVQTIEPFVNYCNYSMVAWGGTKSGASGPNFSVVPAVMVDGSMEDDVVPDDSGMTLSMNPGMKPSILSCVMCHNCCFGWSRVLSCSVADGGTSMSAACMTRITFLSDSSTASDWMTRHCQPSIPHGMSTMKRSVPTGHSGPCA